MRARACLCVFLCVFSLLGLVGASPSASAAEKKKKTWPSKKHHKAHHKAKPASKSTKSAPKSGAPAPAEQGDEDEEGESDEADEQEAEAKQKPKARAANPAAAAAGEGEGEDNAREAASERSRGEDEGEGDTTVVRRKAKRPIMMQEGAAPIALEVEAGPSVMHRTFDFHDPLSNHLASATAPYSYELPDGPVPFIDVAFYPGAFATRGLAANLGLVAHFDKLVGTKTQAPDGSTVTPDAQLLEVGARARLAVAAHELGLTVSYGKQTFHPTPTDPGPSNGSTIPNVDYTFAGFDLDGRLRFARLELGAYVGTRLVFDTGALGNEWFSTVKTTSIDAGLSVAFRLTEVFGVVAGANFTRYGFDFNPVPPSNPSIAIAGGAIDQYISGYLAVRVSLAGS